RNAAQRINTRVMVREACGVELSVRAAHSRALQARRGEVWTPFSMLPFVLTFFLGWQTCLKTAFLELTEVGGGVAAETSSLATASPALAQVGTQPPPILLIPRPQFQPFIRAQSCCQARHHTHRPLHHQTR